MARPAALPHAATEARSRIVFLPARADERGAFADLRGKYARLSEARRVATPLRRFYVTGGIIELYDSFMTWPLLE
jgi:hypothetical protein